MGVLCPLTPNQREFMKVVEDYNNTADNGNLMSETAWPKYKVAAVGRSLIRRGIIEYFPVAHGGCEGGVYEKITRDTKKKGCPRIAVPDPPKRWVTVKTIPDLDKFEGGQWVPQGSVGGYQYRMLIQRRKKSGK